MGTDQYEDAATKNFENWHADEINSILASLDALRRQVEAVQLYAEHIGREVFKDGA